MEQGNSASALIKFQIKRHLLGLSKQFLIILEDIHDGEEVNYDKRRKRILDSANDSIREIETQIDSLKIDYHE